MIRMTAAAPLKLKGRCMLMMDYEASFIDSCVKSPSAFTTSVALKVDPPIMYLSLSSKMMSSG